MILPATKTRTGLNELFASGYEAQEDKDLRSSYSNSMLGLGKFSDNDSAILFPIPEGLSPSYKPIPFLLKLASASVALLLTTLTPWALTTWVRPMVQAIWHDRGSFRLISRRNNPWNDFVAWFIKGIAVYAITTGGLKELPRYRPNRIQTKVLTQRFYLPSKLSFYSSLNGIELGNIHWLHVKAKNTTKEQFSHAHFNHGFGASSLSWLPSLRLLSERLGITSAYAHDAPGFGFTDRTSRYFDDYSCERSAEIGLALLNETENEVLPNSTILLVGHSMGAFTTLQMAVSMDKAVNLRIILVAPAFGLVRKTRSRESLEKRKQQGLVSMWADSIAVYALRRIFGTPRFVRAALQLAWANPLKDSDVLRFQWPSIARGWERGILRFARTPLPSDERLFRRVLALPNLQSINVVVGDSDRIIKLSNIRKFLAPFPTVPFSIIENCGHNPFEEDCEAFVAHVQKCLL